MEIFDKKIKKKDFEKTEKEFLILGFKVQEKQEYNSFYKVSFIRDLKEPILSECISDYKIYKKQEIPSIIPLFVIIPIVFVLLTLFLIFFMNDKNNFQLYFLSYLLPALILFVLISAYSLYRMFKINNYLQKGEEIQNKIYLKAKNR